MGFESQHQLPPMIDADLSDRRDFRDAYLRPALEAGLIEITIPDKLNSRLQQYGLTDKGCAWLAAQERKSQMNLCNFNWRRSHGWQVQFLCGGTGQPISLGSKSALWDIKKDSRCCVSPYFSMVAGVGFEPTTFGL